MGMLLMMAIILACASIWVEVKLVNGIPTVKRLNRDGLRVKKGETKIPYTPFTSPVGVNIDGSVVGIGLSLVLSVILGGFFGAAGLVVMVAGLLSTAVTEPFWGFKRAQEKRVANGSGGKVHAALSEFNLLVGRPAARTTKAALRPANKGLVYMHQHLRDAAIKRDLLAQIREEQRKSQAS